MDADTMAIAAFLETVHPYDNLPRDELARVAGFFSRRDFPAGQPIYAAGDKLDGLFLIENGDVEITDQTGAPVSLLTRRNSFGERGLMRDGKAMTAARAVSDTELLLLPAEAFRTLLTGNPSFERFFTRGRPSEVRGSDLTTRKVADLMARAPVVCAPGATVAEAARIMRDAHVSSLGVVDEGRFVGLLTTRDLAGRVLAEGLSPTTKVASVMTPDPVSLEPDALGSDVLNLMLERRIGHLPITKDGQLIGMITQTDLTRFQAVSSAVLIRDIADASRAEEMAGVTARIPELLVQLVGGNQPHEVVTRLVTDIADAVTRRLLTLGEQQFGAAPVPYLWLACGSQGRQEQTGTSDQDNCLMIDDRATTDDLGYFQQLARFVSDGLHQCGYVYCPGDMMATAERWRQPVRVWRDYFTGWIKRPSPEAQMLASVMFDLRAIGGDKRLFADLQGETLEAASRNSIFVAHMISNSLKHVPPLGMIRGFATIRSGEHRNQIDMKHNGVVPVADLARVYALQGRISAVNTRARLIAAEATGVISSSGGRDFLDAYDVIASMRLEHQARRVRAGEKPDNYLTPSELSDFERSHLRDAFVVVRTMQSAAGHGKGAVL